MTAASAVIPDSLTAWIHLYAQLAITGVRSPAVAQKIALHLDRFLDFYTHLYGHDRISTCLRRDVLAWQTALQTVGLAPATVNNLSPPSRPSPPGYMPRRPASFPWVIRRKGLVRWASDRSNPAP